MNICIKSSLSDVQSIPLMIALVDIASGYFLGYELAESENASVTVRLITTVCREYGIFDHLQTDNGRAFSGHLVAGGNSRKYRKQANPEHGVRPMGICYHLGIDLHFCGPGQSQAKYAESKFSPLSREIDDAPEFKGAHAGHEPTSKPSSKIKPVSLDVVKDVVARRIRRHNEEIGRRSQGAQGRSYADIFEAGWKARSPCYPTEAQLARACLIYKPVAVDRSGQIKIDGWVYGDTNTQIELLKFHGKNQRVLFGRDPDNFEASGLVYDKDMRLVCDNVLYVARGKYDDVDGIRVGKKNKVAAVKATERAELANNYMKDSELKDALAALDAPERNFKMKISPVVKGHFKEPLSGKSKRTKADGLNNVQDIPAEYLKNMDTEIAARLKRNS